jgi:hypothetical protein
MSDLFSLTREQMERLRAVLRLESRGMPPLSMIGVC